jgi:hypothetical protein
LNDELVMNGCVRYCGSSTTVVTVNHSLPKSEWRLKYSVTTALPLYGTPPSLTGLPLEPQSRRQSSTRALFHASIPGDIITYRNHYAATADGQRFLVDSAGTRESDHGRRELERGTRLDS